MRRYTVTVDGTPFTIDVEETAADRFVVTLGDRTFEATLEEAADLPGSVITPGMPLQPAPSPIAAPAPRTQGNAATMPRPSTSRDTLPTPRAGPTGAGGTVVAAPMPGVVLDVLVSPGAAVRRGDGLLVLEAMKMRNTIQAPRAGIVVELVAEGGRPVAAGEPLLRLVDPG